MASPGEEKIETPPVVRRAVSADLDLLVDFARALEEEEGGRSGLTRETLGAWIDSPHIVFLLAPAESPRGFAMLYPGVDLASGSLGWHFADLYVAPNHRRAGVGRRLIAEAAAICRGGGGEWLSWTMRRGNHGAARFYAAIGATRVELDFQAMGPRALDTLIASRGTVGASA